MTANTFLILEIVTSIQTDILEGMDHPITVIGAGLAGTEAAWQIARAGLRVDLYEMRPTQTTPAHKTAYMAELVCSNSLKSETENWGRQIAAINRILEA